VQKFRRVIPPPAVEVYLRPAGTLPVFPPEARMDSHELLCRLRKTDRVRSPGATADPLAGGVSSEIWLVTDGPERFVVKRALPRLKVRDDWFADPARNTVEYNCLAYLSEIACESVPRLLFRDAEAGLFAMEFLDERFANWKTELLRGVIRDEDVVRAAKLMATIHAASWGDSAVQAKFQTWPNFFALRAESYLLTTGARHPKLRSLFETEAERLGRSSQALVHGDFSPKNILISRERLVLLDCEAAWFGDPAFDAAFLLNHLFLKALHLPKWRENFLRLALLGWSEYRAVLEERLRSRWDEDISSRIGRLLLMLMLARMDGKSPVEYIVEERKKDLVRAFVGSMLPANVFAMEELTDRWRRSLTTL
jgi:aminoglycoside phosphotransferase (APT) family kinase protein